ncbi:MAG: zinc and cadmium transporter [Actinomycetota bacterium]|jgi:zinc and cadmium transporter|nr:zinc and cadmium transporter [Actinomycetota bacterium]
MDSTVLIQSMVALVFISGLSLVGALTLTAAPTTLRKSLVVLIAFAAGALLGDAFVHILPEVAESETGFDLTASLSLIAGVVVFFTLEKVLHWHHSHIPNEEVMHPVATMNLVGDGLHNFIDGAIVAAAFSVSLEVGIATAIAVALHEIPQELGDFAILIHAGLTPKRALLLNFATALTAVIGGLATLALGSVASVERFLLPFTAGAFVYIASTDLIPELHKEPEPMKSAIQVVALVAGVGTMVALLAFE